MTYFAGQRVTLSTEVRNLSGTLTDTTLVLTLTKPDGTTVTPAVNHNGTGLYSADVTLDTAGDWLRAWVGTGAVEVTDVDQVHVIAPGLRIVGLAEVKEHGNITSSANDRELLDFIGTAQQIIEKLVGVTVPQTFTQTITDTAPRNYYSQAALVRHSGGHPFLWLARQPVLSVTSVTEYGATVDPALYALDVQDGTVGRTDRRHWFGSAGYPLTVVYRAGRQPIPEAIRWAAKELIIHLWRSTQAQRGGRARNSDLTDAVAGFALPNRVRDALEPYLLPPVVA